MSPIGTNVVYNTASGPVPAMLTSSYTQASDLADLVVFDKYKKSAGADFLSNVPNGGGEGAEGTWDFIAPV